MTWTMREACEVVLVGRRSARRQGQQFKLDPQRMAHVGFQPAEVAEIERAADAIEQFTEATLAGLKRKLKPEDAQLRD